MKYVDKCQTCTKCDENSKFYQDHGCCEFGAFVECVYEPRQDNREGGVVHVE